MNNTIKKIAAICSVILIAGLIIGGIGYALGGVRGIDKLAEKHSWIQGDPGERTVNGKTYDSFSSVEVTGNADVYMVTEKYFKDKTWQGEMELLDSAETDTTEVFRVIVIKGKEVRAPEISVESGLLKIDAKEKGGGISFNFSVNDRTPRILICCPEEEMDSLRVNVDTGNILLGGITYKEANLETDTGYIQTYGVIGARQEMDSDTGDVSLSGVFKNLTKASSDTGDVKLSGFFSGAVEADSDTGDVIFETSSFLKAFGDIELKTDTGDISVRENGQDIATIDSTPAHYTHEGEGTQLEATSDTGDIKVSFGQLED